MNKRAIGIIVFILFVTIFVGVLTQVFYLWSDQYKTWFLRTGDYGSLIYIFLLVFLIGFFLKQLLKIGVHRTLHPKRLPRRRKR